MEEKNIEGQNVELSNVQQDNKKSNKPIFVVILIIVALLIGFGCGLLLSKSFGSEKDNSSNESNADKKDSSESGNNNANTENDNSGNESNADINSSDEKANNSNEIKSIEIDEEILKLYNKYHSEDNPVSLSGSAIETKIYDSLIFEVSNLNESMVNDYQNKIAQLTINKLNNQEYYKENDKDSIIRLKLKESFEEFLGKRIEYNKKLTNCLEFGFDNKYYYRNNCGDTAPNYAVYTLLRAEKDNSNIYLYEDVKEYNDDGNNIGNYTYKWTYELQDDGVYYFLKSEKI